MNGDVPSFTEFDPRHIKWQYKAAYEIEKDYDYDKIKVLRNARYCINLNNQQQVLKPFMEYTIWKYRKDLFNGYKLFKISRDNFFFYVVSFSTKDLRKYMSELIDK